MASGEAGKARATKKAQEAEPARAPAKRGASKPAVAKPAAAKGAARPRGRGAAVRRKGAATRERIVDTAERLFAEQGIDAVSLNEIVQVAGVNSAAVHYHFRSKEGLVDAILTRGTTAWADERERMLDELESKPRPRLRDVVAAMVLPTTRIWETTDGRSYVRFLASVSNHPVYSRLLIALTDPLTTRWLNLLEKATPKLPPGVRLRRFAFAKEFVYHALSVADGPVQLWLDAHTPPPERPLTDDLIDFLTGALGAPVSNEA
jgi:AcrR family transcriptional regulator